jgi:hypothetical protein
MSQESNVPIGALTNRLTRRAFLEVAGGSLALPLAGLAFGEDLTHQDGERKSLRIRRNLTRLSATEKAELVEAILKLKEARSPFDMRFNYYDQFVAWHRLWTCHGGHVPRGEGWK